MRDQSAEVPVTSDYYRKAAWGSNLLQSLAVSVIALVFLPACGSTAGDQHQTSTTHAPATTTASTPLPVASPRTVTWVDVQVGDCLAAIPRVDIGEVTATVVDCTSPHLAEVYSRAPLTVNAAVADVANQQCAAQFPAYTGQPVDGSRYTIAYLVDSNQDRTIVDPTTGPSPSTAICLLQSASGQPLTASARH